MSKRSRTFVNCVVGGGGDGGWPSCIEPAEVGTVDADVDATDATEVEMGMDADGDAVDAVDLDAISAMAEVRRGGRGCGRGAGQR